MAKVNFTFHVYKIGSFYHMLESLSEFHHSYRDEAKKYWLKKTGPLLNDEKVALSEFKTVLEKYPFGHQKYLGKFLETKSKYKALKKLRENVSENDYRIIINTLKIFKPRFEKIWQAQKQSLGTWKKLLAKKVNCHNIEIVTEIGNFLPTKPNLNDIKVFLLISGGENDGIGGGANLGPDRITLEVGIISKTHKNRVLTVFWHEVFHSIAGTSFKNDILSYLSEYIKKNPLPEKILNIEPGRNSLNIMNEGATKIFETHISDKYYDYDLKKRAKENLKSLKTKRRKFISLNYFLILNNGLGLLREYLNSDRRLDEKFLDNLVNIYEDYADLIKK
jgi:hypothetical protein